MFQDLFEFGARTEFENDLETCMMYIGTALHENLRSNFPPIRIFLLLLSKMQ